MVFASQEFFLFLLVLLTIYALATSRSSRAGRTVLIAASMFFYLYWRPSNLVILIASICANFVVGNFIRNNVGTRAGTLGTAIGIAGNLMLLGYYKYLAFLLQGLNQFAQQHFEISAIVFPIGISFFTFQQIAFLVDEHKGRVGKVEFWDYFLLVSFFPHVIAGPIVRQSDFLWQLTKNRNWRLRSSQVALGLALFAIGSFKKLVLIDPQVPHIDLIFNHAAAGNAVSMFDGWIAALGYSFQIYFDFSAYSDMAIGLAYMFGLRLPVNFFSPYKATSFREFWRRWHITLSRFLRDHLYIPLGGSRHGFPRTVGALLVTMGLGGLWHGAGWTFVVWGLVHGGLLVLNHLYDRIVKPRFAWVPRPDGWLVTTAYRCVCVVVTFTTVTAAWVYFRASDIASAHAILAGMFGATNAPTISDPNGIVGMLPYYLLIVWFTPNTSQIFRKFDIALDTDEFFDRAKPLFLDRIWTYRLGTYCAVVSAIILLLDWSFLSGLSPFIYFQF